MEDNLSPEERERRLDEAADRYLDGELTREQFNALERQYAPDYLGAAQVLADRRVVTEVWQESDERTTSAPASIRIVP